MACLCLCYKVGQREVGVRACHKVGMVVLQEVVLDALCHTAQYAYDEAVLASFAFCGQGIQAMIDFLFGIVSYRAGVQKYGISLVQRLGRLIASHLHDTGHYLGVGYVHLTAVSLDI